MPALSVTEEIDAKGQEVSPSLVYMKQTIGAAMQYTRMHTTSRI